ncbi:peptidase S9 [Arthrobacter sp. MYb227]|uniref:S9 family peptidase n=1 Tax=Arthrobacter sp. MYb227 TaxID=1848601 RepID=UPI000CFDD526|nr:S9 family peptidase [Arthrobacter sp. MYb227]PQZ93896.1 peptidase S9 [Arthrobacter sp. MYb227]
MKPEQLELLTTVSAPSLSPDSARVVVATSRPSFANDSYVGQLWELNPNGSTAPRRLTRGVADSAPQYSPDGAWIGFLRADTKGKNQLAIVEAAGGEPRVLTDRLLGVSGFAWSPDGHTLAFTSRTAAKGRYASVEGVGATAEDPRRITTFNYRGDGIGFTDAKTQQLFTLAVPGLDEEPFVKPAGRAADEVEKPPTGLPEARLRVETIEDIADPCFSPDGKYLYFSAALHPGHDTDLRSQIYRVPSLAENPSVPELVLGGAESPWAYRSACFGNDGSTLFVLGQQIGDTGVDFIARLTAVCSIDAESMGILEATVLTDEENLDYTECGQLVASGHQGVLAMARVRGTGELHLITTGGRTSVLAAGPQVIHGAATDGSRVIVSFIGEESPGECAVVEDGKLRSLTDFAHSLRAHARHSTGREVTFNAPDGYPVHGWIHLPAGKGPHPVLLNIHGGPFSQYGPEFFDEVQTYTGAGYAVLQCNPRGSASYGREHGLAIRHAMGTVDFQDVMAFLDGALAGEPALDAERTGVLGGSYGGYLTAWTIAHEHRFAAALVERGFLDPASFVGTSDIGWFFAHAYTGSDPAQVAAQSPMAAIDQVSTPTLVMHSEGDYRCPLEQAQRYYVGLKQRGVPTELVLFPGESHGLSRGGSPWHRRQRFEIILEWFNKYLPVRNS